MKNMSWKNIDNYYWFELWSDQNSQNTAKPAQGWIFLESCSEKFDHATPMNMKPEIHLRWGIWLVPEIKIKKKINSTPLAPALFLDMITNTSSDSDLFDKLYVISWG